jgi:hypothetical protein
MSSTTFTAETGDRNFGRRRLACGIVDRANGMVEALTKLGQRRFTAASGDPLCQIGLSTDSAARSSVSAAWVFSTGAISVTSASGRMRVHHFKASILVYKAMSKAYAKQKGPSVFGRAPA